MFTTARLTLTAWYLLLILCITTVFSIAIYQVSTREIKRITERYQQMQDEWQGRVPGFIPPRRNAPNIEELETAKQRLFIRLVLLNGLILVISGGLAYFLAGRTLSPIKRMVEEQHIFVSNSSHELRTPLAALRAELEGSLLEPKISDTQARALIASNLEEVSTLQQLTDRMLELASTPPTQENSRQVMQPVSLKQSLESSLQQVQSIADLKQITLQASIQDATVLANAQSLQELWNILLDNALKYSPPKSTIYVATQLTSKRVKVHVKDEGLGIPKVEQEKIFDRFYRVDRSRSQSKGFGLGLSIAKHITLQHSGSITVRNNQTKGSTFTVDLPSKA